MATAIDFYSNTSPVFSEELMRALEPFMNCSSPTSVSSDSSSFSSYPSCSYTSATSLQPNLYPDFCSPSSTYMFSNGSKQVQLGLITLPCLKSFKSKHKFMFNNNNSWPILPQNHS